MAGEGSKKTQFKDKGVGVGRRNPIAFAMPDPYDEILRSLPNRSEKLRQWVIKCMIEDGLVDQHSSTQTQQKAS
ncbi:hypothetical protein [Iningainema tapete]|uniref:Uncharacterized protein n=1 Tax=Iningainema tapete BLCC-T55 TaxID=2748662 RepID=A0A8J6XIS2_9CYAN|nr:hypothetical protein [Iningainema tapete]MBD2776754.1 hypothetical protein [Iningainema tapete BLCC-T55]